MHQRAAHALRSDQSIFIPHNVSTTTNKICFPRFYPELIVIFVLIGWVIIFSLSIFIEFVNILFTLIQVQKRKEFIYTIKRSILNLNLIVSHWIINDIDDNHSSF